MRIAIGVVVAIAACKGGSTASSGTASGSGSALASGSAPVAVVIDAAVADAAIDANTACKPKCLYAAEHALVEAITKHAADCKAEWYAADDCEGLLYARNCIYAAYGNVFKTDAWKDRFTKEPWYKPNPSFDEKKHIPAYAMSNIRQLKKQYEACVSPAPPVTPEDKKLATDMYQRVINSEENVDGIDELDLSAARDSLRNLHVDEKTAFAYDGAPKDGRRTITMTGLYWAVGGGEYKPHESAVLVFEGDKLVEIR
jgi:hypothetical protein